MRIDEENLELLTKVFDTSAASIILTDVNGDIKYVNSQFEKRTGYNSKEVLGKNPKILKSGETDPDKYKTLWTTITSGNEWRGEFRNKKKNGDLFWEYSTVYPIINKNNMVTHFLAVKEDITEIKKMDDEIKKEKLKRKIYAKFKYDFLNRISHEIRTPLNVIICFTDILKEKVSSEKNKEIDAYLLILNDLNNKILETVEFILQISELKPQEDNPKLDFLKSNFLNQLVEAIEEPIQTILGLSQILKVKYDFNKDEDLKTVLEIMASSCQRVTSTINIIVKCSQNTTNEMEFIKSISEEINKEKETLPAELSKSPGDKVTAHSKSGPTLVHELTKSVDKKSYREIESEFLEGLLKQSDKKYQVGKNENFIQTNKVNPFSLRQELVLKNGSRIIINRNRAKLFEHENIDEVCIVFINMANALYTEADKFKNFFKNIRLEKNNRIIVDLTFCKKIDSSFLGVLVASLKQRKTENVTISLALNYKILPPSFVLSNLDILFQVFGSLQEALDSLLTV